VYLGESGENFYIVVIQDQKPFFEDEPEPAIKQPEPKAKCSHRSSQR
jgi:hypothetical protein